MAVLLGYLPASDSRLWHQFVLRRCGWNLCQPVCSIEPALETEWHCVHAHPNDPVPVPGGNYHCAAIGKARDLRCLLESARLGGPRYPRCREWEEQASSFEAWHVCASASNLEERRSH